MGKATSRHLFRYGGFELSRVYLLVLFLVVKSTVQEKNPYPPLERSLEIKRSLKAKYEAKLEFPGERMGAKQKPTIGEGGRGYRYFL